MAEEREQMLVQQSDEQWKASTSRRGRSGRYSCLSIYATTVTIITFVVFASLLLQWHARCETEIHDGELDRPMLATIKRHLTGGLKYDDAGRLYRDTSGEVQSYVGNGSGVDQAWKVFDAIQTVQLRPRDVSVAGLYIDRRPMVITIPDVFHQLHCLNQIRMALYDTEYLAVEDPKRGMHVDHCIDYIRQVIECRSDMTPLKLYYSEPAGRMMVDFEGDRTCKDFDAVRDWAWQNRATEIVRL